MNVKTLNKGLLNSNPFNPKRNFSQEEMDVLKKSLEKWGLQAALQVCEDYREGKSGQYIVIDGNTRYLKTKEEVVTCIVIPDIKNEIDLQELTIDFCSAIKSRNYSALFQMYRTCKDRLDQEHHKLFNKMQKDIEAATVNQDIIRKAMFNEVVILKFDDETAYEEAKKPIRSFKKKLKADSQFIQWMKDNNKDITERDVAEHIVEIMALIKQKKEK